MGNAANVRLIAPKPFPRAILRPKLVNGVLDSPTKLVYLHAGAGYGKTTLLSQIAASCPNMVWVSLDHEGINHSPCSVHDKYLPTLRSI